MLCPYCKSLLRDGMDTCPYCGNAVPSVSGSSVQQEPSVRYVSPPQPQPASDAARSSGKTKGLTAALVCSLLLCGGVLTALLLQNSGGSTAPPVRSLPDAPAAEQTAASSASLTSAAADSEITDTVTETDSETTAESTTSAVTERETEPEPEPETQTEPAADRSDLMDSLLISQKLYFGMSAAQAKNSMRSLDPLNYNPDPVYTNGVVSYEYCFARGRSELGKSAAIALPIRMTLYFKNDSLQQVDTCIGQTEDNTCTGTYDEVLTAFNTIYDNCDSVFEYKDYYEAPVGESGTQYHHAFTGGAPREAHLIFTSLDDEQHYCLFQYTATIVLS